MDAADQVDAPRDPARTPRRKDVPLWTPPERRELFAHMVDSERMLAVFRRALPALCDAELRITSCSAKPTKSRQAIREEKLDVVYKLRIAIGGAPEAEFALLGIAPASAELLAALEARRALLRGHPWAASFRELALHVPELQLALILFPLDPALPGVAEMTGNEGARLLAAVLPDCRLGARITALDCDLVHYKPFDRAVLRLRVTLENRRKATYARTVYAKLFADDHGAATFRQLTHLWAAARSATHLRMPEPLGYDAERRMLLMSEASGENDLSEWIKCLEHGRPLPAGVDLERLDRCAIVGARALLELQRSGVQLDVRRTFGFELERVKRDRDLLVAEVRGRRPELAASAEALVARLEALAPADERLAPAHGCYRHKQMLGDERALTLVDWDGMSLASPALDAATFLGRLLKEPRSRPGSAPELERMGASFRRTFLAERPDLERDLDLYEGLVLTEQLLRSFRRPRDGDETEREARHLAEAAGRMLDRVERARERRRGEGV